MYISQTTYFTRYWLRQILTIVPQRLVFAVGYNRRPIETGPDVCWGLCRFGPRAVTTMGSCHSLTSRVDSHPRCLGLL